MHKAGHDANDILILDAVFLRDAVITENHIILLPCLNDPVQHIMLRRSAVQHDIIFLAALVALLLHGKQITSLFQQRQHTDTDIAVGHFAVLFKVFLIGQLIHQSLRCL